MQCGLVVDLHPTDYELRLGILQSKVEAHKSQYPDLTIEPNVLEFLALRISTNVRVLEGALTRLFAFASLVGRPINLELAQDCLADVLRASERKITVEEIQRKVSEHYNIRLSDMIGPKRVRTYARPRQVAMYLSKQLTSRSLPEIGRRFGGRDHTTVMHGVKRIEDLKVQDGQVAEDLEMLRRALEA
jgi:chromosomal replication initiator protein